MEFLVFIFTFDFFKPSLFNCFRKQENCEKNEKTQNKANGEKERRTELAKSQKLELQPIIENHSFIENLISDRDKILQGINCEIGEILLKNVCILYTIQKYFFLFFFEYF